MGILFLLILPIVIGLVGFLTSKGKVNWVEFVVQELVLIVLVSATFYVAAQHKMKDVEIWNGVIKEKNKIEEECSESYSCNCHSCSCDEDGCSTCCDTCYRYWDITRWDAWTSNNENAYSAGGCYHDLPNPPVRWQEIVVGEPTAIEHSYDNYIKGNPDTILRRTGTSEDVFVPPYPKVYDWYNATRFIATGISDERFVHWDTLLDKLNAQLGAKKQVNTIIVVTDYADVQYAEILKERWLGGKKNDVVVIVGAPEYPKIGWVSVVSWTEREDMKITIRNRILELDEFDGEAIVNIAYEEIESKFVRREMKDFEYLKARIEPSGKTQFVIFIIGTIMSLILTFIFWKYDPFEDRSRYYYH